MEVFRLTLDIHDLVARPGHDHDRHRQITVPFAESRRRGNHEGRVPGSRSDLRRTQRQIERKLCSEACRNRRRREHLADHLRGQHAAENRGNCVSNYIAQSRNGRRR